MSIKRGRQLGFLASLAMLVGSVVGIGIFLKNHSILKANEWSGSGMLLSWITGGILSFAAALSFSEIASFKNGKTAGLADWSEKVGGKKFGYFVRFNYPIFYFVILDSAIAFFAAETIISIINSFTGAQQPHLGFIFILAVALFTFFVILNFLSIKLSGIFQQITVVLKFIPLILVAILGIIMVGTNNHPNPNGPELFGINTFTNNRSFNFTKMLAALPAVLFAYDSFLIVGTLRKKMAKPDKLPFVVIIGMTIVVALYMLIAVSASLHGSGMVSGSTVGAEISQGKGIFDQIFNNFFANIAGKFVIIFVCISTLGILNGVTSGVVATFTQLLESNTIFGSKKLKKIFNDKAPLVLIGIAFFIGFIFVGIPSVIMNSDVVLDAFSNFTTLFFFAIYGLIILLYTLRRNDFKTSKIKSYLFKPAAIIAIFGIGFVIAYQIGYGMTIKLFEDLDKDTSMGLFATHGNNLNQLGLAITFLTSAIIFFVLPVVNAKLVQKFENRSVYVSTQFDEN